MNEPGRIGVFGGTFDPIHNAHLRIARCARDFGGLDLILFVVSARPPHKRRGTTASAEQRFAMVEAAVAGEPAFRASRIEIDRDGPSYTVDTLRELRQRYPQAKLFLIMGLDSLRDLPHWKAPDEILALADVLAAPRPGDWTLPPSLDGHYQILPLEKVPVSSTEVRERTDEGLPLDDMLPPPVEALVRKWGLYRDAQGAAQ